MTKGMEVFRFELAYQLRRRSTLLYVVALLGMCMAFLRMMAQGSSLDGTYFNAPFAVLAVVVVGSMIGLLLLAGFAGDAATRDIDTRMDALFYTAPIGRRDYLLGRFLGAFTVGALLFAALPIGAFLAAWMPWVEAGSLGPMRISSHLRPYLLFALPNAFVATAVLFGFALLTRRAIASYAGAGLLFFTSLVCGKLLAPRLGWDVAALLDPLGYTTTMALWQGTNALQKNAFVLAADGALLANRALWLGLGLAVLGVAYARFRFAHVSAGRQGRRNETAVTGFETRTIAVPSARRFFGAPTRMRQLLAVTIRSLRDLHASRAWWIVPLLALLFIQAAPDLANLEMGIPGPLTTARIVDFLTADVSVLFTLLIALSAGELVWRDRGARMHALADVTPVPDWISLAGRFLAIALMLAAALVIYFGAGVVAQSVLGTDRYDLPLYVQTLFGLLLPEYLLAAALAMAIHVLVNQKYVANVLIVLVPVVIDVARRLGVDHLLLYGSLPRWHYSEIAGFAPSVEARLWFTVYFGGWAVLFLLLAYLFWVRGEELGMRYRFALARRRVTRIPAIAGAVALAVVAGAGGFIFYNRHVLHESPTNAELEQKRAEFERRYGRYASLPQPTLSAVRMYVDFHPQRRTASIRGSYRLENRSTASIEAIHVATSSGARTTSVSFDRGSRLTLGDDALDYRIYALDRALRPGESLRMEFQVVIETNVFQTEGTAPVVRNGSVLIHRPRRADHWLPLVGYQRPRELNNAGLRKKYGLRERSPYPLLGDKPLGDERNGYERVTLETIVGTDAGQLGVAPGAIRRTWVENGRRYVHYLTDAPISHHWTITSANYAVRRATWRPAAGSGQPVAIEIFHHPTHTANVERMVRGVRASLDHNTREFSPYPYRQLRFVEYPSDAYWLQMTAHSGLVTYAEGFSLIRPEADPRRIDFAFAVAAHETGHQWWGHQLTPTAIEGSGFLVESLAWYSGMLAVEEALGREHLQSLLDMLRANYLQPNQPRAVPLLRTVDWLDAYRTGPFAMYALRETVGVERVNGALRNLLSRFPPGHLPSVTSRDFYAEVRAATPAAFHGLLKDLFEEITFWELRAKSIEVRPAGNGAHRVALQVEAQKLKGDGTGVERPAEMSDLVEIAVFDQAGRSLHRARHRLRSGVQTIEVVVPSRPARAVVDPDRELLDRRPEDNEVRVEGGS
jgi:ABC-2 type transport system permease protein